MLGQTHTIVQLLAVIASGIENKGEFRGSRYWHNSAAQQAGGACVLRLCIIQVTLWEKLTLFLDYPELELSNNLAENAMRPVALGRSNWIHIGSSQAGPRIAAILSVIESCRRLKIRVRDYLTQVLPGLGDMPIQRVTELTPTAWAAKAQS